ncbi:unnamed protein product [Lymnaea stagnalis]|uniref:Carbonic anhydrase n=1 Tax=Lymnaea stagnalis TaxID=6523 RepID=A0AAV2IM65_LYMST
MQSPINIDTGGAWFDPELRPMDLGDYSLVDHVQMTLVNRGGHTAEISYSGKALYIRGGGLLGEYQLDQLHFHWGPRFRNGSEHKLDWRHYPMELHIVHHQRKKMSDGVAAAKEPNGLAVYAVLFKMVPHDNPKLNEIIRHLDQIQLSGNEIKIASFPLLEVLPATVARLFYRYDGSLTTPPCYESVIWTIAVDFIDISEDQINKFRSLEGKEGQQLTDTHRPIQRLNGRKVRTTVHTKYIYVPSHAVGTHVNTGCLFPVMLLAPMLTLGVYFLSCCWHAC